MPSIAIDARMLNASGIGVYLKHILPALCLEFKVQVMGNEQEIEQFEWAKQVSVIPLNAPIYSVKEQWKLYQKVPACDLFWSPHYNIPLLPIKAKKRVVTIHDTFHLAYKHTLNFTQKTYASLFLNAAVRMADQVLTVSRFSEQEIIKYTRCSPEKLSVIYNGVDRTCFTEGISLSENADLRQELPNLPEKYILFVGNVKPHKNLITLLRAYSSLSLCLQQEYHLVIVGQKDGFLTPDQEIFHVLEKQPQLKKFVHFTGFVPDKLLPVLYNCASLSVFPSLYEGFGMPPLEAMACGCPVVAARSASIPEVCADAVLYFNPLQASELTIQMERVLQNVELQMALAEKGREQCAKFSWEAAASQHVRIFKELVTSP
ncbi:glycosyltransferase family 4 protein [Rufibacter immobilis]|nr:glycosyltransferase family 1 protein [Rufibacter immobilis]